MSMNEFETCRLCEWNCGVNRNKDAGVCNVKMPEVAYTCLAESLESYSITLLGCNFRCLYCNAYRLSQYPDTNWFYRGYVEPHELAKEAMDTLKKAYNDGLIASGMIRYENFEQALEDGKEKCLEHLKSDLERQSLDDIHNSMSWWACFNEASQIYSAQDPDDLINYSPLTASNQSSHKMNEKKKKAKKKKRQQAKASKRKNRR